MPRAYPVSGPLIVVGRNERIVDEVNVIAAAGHALAYDGERRLHRFKSPRPNVASLCVVNEIRAAPDMPVIEDRHIALRHNIAAKDILHRLVCGDDCGWFVELDPVDEMVGASFGKDLAVGSQAVHLPGRLMVALDRRRHTPPAARPSSTAKVISSRPLS